MKPDGIKHKPFFVDQKVRRAIAYMIPVDENCRSYDAWKRHQDKPPIFPSQKNI